MDNRVLLIFEIQFWMVAPPRAQQYPHFNLSDFKEFDRGMFSFLVHTIYILGKTREQIREQQLY